MADFQPRALFAISSLGLGHATRSLSAISDFLKLGWRIHVISIGTAYLLLHREFAEKPGVSIRRMGDYPPLERGNGLKKYWYLLVDLLATWQLIRHEHISPPTFIKRNISWPRDNPIIKR